MWGDVRYAVRAAFREPQFFAFAIAIMGLGIGANTAMFSIVSPILLRPLPFEEPERLVWITNTGEMTAVLVLIAGLAAYVPARRASRIDPMSVLRLA